VTTLPLCDSANCFSFVERSERDVSGTHSDILNESDATRVIFGRLRE
jgi:hypothetical protein